MAELDEEPLHFMTAVIPPERRAEYDELKTKQANALARGDLAEHRALGEQERQLEQFAVGFSAGRSRSGGSSRARRRP